MQNICAADTRHAGPDEVAAAEMLGRGGCGNLALLNVLVAIPPSADFTYYSKYYCELLQWVSALQEFGN